MNSLHVTSAHFTIHLQCILFQSLFWTLIYKHAIFIFIFNMPCIFKLLRKKTKQPVVLKKSFMGICEFKAMPIGSNWSDKTSFVRICMCCVVCWLTHIDRPIKDSSSHEVKWNNRFVWSECVLVWSVFVCLFVQEICGLDSIVDAY